VKLPDLPIKSVLGEIAAALASQSAAVVVAPPGSGKTTVVPLALLAEQWLAGQRIIILEPRRLAARAAARRMSELLGEAVGETVGYRIRFERRLSKRTRIEVVTEGILSRMLQNDPELAGVGLVVFDEFHERSLQADLALALCLDVRDLRPDLRILVMSATLDMGPISELLGGAPVISGEGRCFPVAVTYLPLAAHATVMAGMARAIRRALREQEGDILAFLPGSGEIRRLAAGELADLVELDILPLYGDLPQAEQDRIFAPARRRRLILATPIAESSLTVQGVGVVVDSGLAKRPRFDPATGLTRLETVKISKASAEQRAGRAGRLAPGHVYRLWSRAIHHTLADFELPEIINADLAPLLLELGLWGVRDPGRLAWLDPPRPGQVEKARILLVRLGAMDAGGLLTDLGKRLARLPLHPRLGLLLIKGEERGLQGVACDLAALLANRDILRGPDAQHGADLELRLELLDLWRRRKTKQATARGADPHACRRVAREAASYRALLSRKGDKAVVGQAGTLLLYGYPDRLAGQLAAGRSHYLLAGGRRARLAAGDPLHSHALLVVPHLDGAAKEGRIYLAAAVAEEEVRADHPQLVRTERVVAWNQEKQRVEARQCSRIGTVVLARQPWPGAPAEEVAASFLEGVRLLGPGCLPWTRASREFQARLVFLHEWLPDEWPSLADDRLFADLAWLTPYIVGMSRVEELKKLDLTAILTSRFSWSRLREIDRLAPSHLEVPSGSRIKLHYEAGAPPVLAARIQEMFGMEETPLLCGGRVPVVVHLLSPARRPLQVTRDLAGFWRTTYHEVKKELKGRYAKHYWPDDPLNARARRGVKPRRRPQDG